MAERGRRAGEADGGQRQRWRASVLVPSLVSDLLTSTGRAFKASNCIALCVLCCCPLCRVGRRRFLARRATPAASAASLLAAKAPAPK